MEIRKPATRKKREHKDYESLFLVKRISSPRRSTYVSADVYKKIIKILPIVDNKITIIGYLDNIFINHLEEYKDDINELYDKNYQKPF